MVRVSRKHILCWLSTRLSIAFGGSRNNARDEAIALIETRRRRLRLRKRFGGLLQRVRIVEHQAAERLIDRQRRQFVGFEDERLEYGLAVLRKLHRTRQDVDVLV